LTPIVSNAHSIPHRQTLKENGGLIVRTSHGGVSRSSSWFSRGQYLPELSSAVLDIVFEPQINTWNGNADIQLKMRDVAIQPNS
jgi:hypothetical protein